MISLGFLIAFIIFAIGILSMGLFIVPQQQIAVIERFGKFNRVAAAGLNIKIPFIETIRKIVTTQIQQLDVANNNKTSDNVTFEVLTSV